MKPWLTYTQAEALIDKSHRTLQRWVKEGRIETRDIDHAGRTYTLLRTTDILRIEPDKKRHAAR